ncbi:MAG: HAMP domain-containing sensor histidine kinase [Tepidimonas sp.]|nr:HAMP domain-containing sensor histidine kinase [Tepidimonas sp.]MDT7928357.1 HAMP domain-containing sensor histidine kinase [Tepidimonas sp.]
MEEKSRSLEQATRELRAVNERLQELDRLKDDFVSSVTHELRTPLTSIRALAEIMRDDLQMDAAQRTQFLDIVVAETERLTRLVNQVLDLAKIESGHANWSDTDVDVVAVARQAARAAEPVLRERGARLDVELPDAPLWVRADADRLQQVLMNLLSNAAKFVSAERGRVVLRVVTHVGSGGAPLVTVEVQDNGPGVPREQQPVIFEKFRQGATRSSGRPARGWGCRSALASSSILVAGCGYDRHRARARVSVSTCRDAATPPPRRPIRPHPPAQETRP